MPLHPRRRPGGDDDSVTIRPEFARPGETGEIPRFELPPGGMPADTAYQLVHDELMLDGNARLNLATFVTTWMEPQARALMLECADKNMIDKDEYPLTAELELRCVNMLARLWHAPEHEGATGTSTAGSSEACMLAGLALKRRHPTDRPNLVMGRTSRCAGRSSAATGTSSRAPCRCPRSTPT